MRCAREARGSGGQLLTAADHESDQLNESNPARSEGVRAASSIKPERQLPWSFREGWRDNGAKTSRAIHVQPGFQKSLSRDS